MKLPRFTLGMIAGVSLSAALVATAYYFLYFPVAEGIYQSQYLPFYAVEGDSNFDVFRRLEDPEYWSSLSESAESEAEEYCRRNNISADVTVRCSGGPEGYEIYYSTGEYTTLHDLLNRDNIKSVIVAHVTSNYLSLMAPIIRGEQGGAGRPATASGAESEGDRKPQSESESTPR